MGTQIVLLKSARFTVETRVSNAGACLTWMAEALNLLSPNFGPLAGSPIRANSPN